MSLVIPVNLVEVFKEKGVKGLKEAFDTYLEKQPYIPGAQSYYIEELKKIRRLMDEVPPTCLEDIEKMCDQIEHEKSFAPFD